MGPLISRRTARRRIPAAVVGCLAVVLAAGGCTGNNTAGNDTSGTDDYLQATPDANVAPAAPNTAFTARMLVKRGQDLGVNGADVLMRVTWASGEAPPSKTVDVATGKRVELQVWSDSSAKVVVEGHPSASATVTPGEPQAVDFTMDGNPTKITVGGTLVATVRPG